jgi:hypothetical protein
MVGGVYIESHTQNSHWRNLFVLRHIGPVWCASSVALDWFGAPPRQLAIEHQTDSLCYARDLVHHRNA